MAIDPHAPAPSEAAVPSAIENEIPAYRAVSALAILALAIGLVGAMSFADLTFLWASGLAVALGLYADRRIRRMPDVLTGRGLAQAAVGVGIVFGLGALTTHTVSAYLLRTKAASFARQLAPVLETKDMAQAVHLMVPPTERKKVTPEEALKQLEGSGRDRGSFDMRTAGLQALHKFLQNDKDSHLEFVEIEASGYERLTPVAAALYRVHGADEDGKESEKYALVELQSNPNHHDLGWFIRDMVFPYRRSTYEIKAPAGEGGHGHSH